MNAIILLTVLSLTMPIFGEETQVKRQDKRGILGLGHAGFGGSPFQGDSLAIGAGYGQSYLGDASLGHGFSVPSYSHSYSAPLYSSQYSGGLGYGGLGYGGRSYSSGGLGYSGIRSGYGTAGFGYGAGSQGGHGIGLSTGYRGW
ncbi:hypothetical protein CAJAP_09054 [Camponotus japonicus]